MFSEEKFLQLVACNSGNLGFRFSFGFLVRFCCYAMRCSGLVSRRVVSQYLSQVLNRYLSRHSILHWNLLFGKHGLSWHSLGMKSELNEKSALRCSVLFFSLNGSRERRGVGVRRDSSHRNLLSVFLTDCSIVPFSASRIALFKLSMKRETARSLIWTISCQLN